VGPLIQKISKAGGIPISMPIIKVMPLSNFDIFDNTLKDLNKYHWIVFTSVNGVDAFFNRLYYLNLDARNLGKIRVAAIGSVTALALETRGIRTDCFPEIHTSQALIELLKKQRLSGNQILLPRADIAGKELPEGLRRLGADVHDLIIYRTVPDRENLREGKEMLLAGQIDVVTLTSPSAVANLISALDHNIDVLNKAVIACIGPVTEDTAVKAGLRVDIVPHKSSIFDLVNAIEEHYSGRVSNESIS
jgi:uroporphyrinogen III methyltransferase/synthase